MKRTSFQDIKVEVRSRIAVRQWPPGELIPNEQELATEFSCSRATVNRALRELAEAGLLERRRKAGTRVVVNPASKATLVIPIMRQEIENCGQIYGYKLILREHTAPPISVTRAMGVPTDQRLLHLISVHTGNAKPFALEDRWINTIQVPSAQTTDFGQYNANEWLVQNAAYSHGDITFTASNAGDFESEQLGIDVGSAMLVMDRSTWDNGSPITSVRIYYLPGYRMQTI
ncbi:MAG: UTRA domain-containing protein [Paracoccaceae bacterium]